MSSVRTQSARQRHYTIELGSASEKRREHFASSETTANKPQREKDVVQ
jgi:hypothetical protein